MSTSTTDGHSERRGKKSARVVCAGRKEFWTTQRQFWSWVRDGVVTYVADGPLTGRFEGRRERLIVSVRHVLLDAASPVHLSEVLSSYGLKRRPAPAKRVR